jgi:hypothetical protein
MQMHLQLSPHTLVTATTSFQPRMRRSSPQQPKPLPTRCSTREIALSRLAAQTVGRITRTQSPMHTTISSRAAVCTSTVTWARYSPN